MLIPAGTDFTPAGFDRVTQRYTLSLLGNSYPSGEGSTSIPAVTLAYDVIENRWKSRYNYHADWYGRVGQTFIGFVGAVMYRHYRSGIYNFMYGSNRTSFVKFSVNPVPVAIKDFYNISLWAVLKWFAPLIEIPPSPKFPAGMKSRLKAPRINQLQGKWVAEILRDYTFPL